VGRRPLADHLRIDVSEQPRMRAVSDNVKRDFSCIIASTKVPDYFLVGPVQYIRSAHSNRNAKYIAEIFVMPIKDYTISKYLMGL